MSSDERIIAARYVDALFDLATEENQQDQVKTDMLKLKSLLESSAPLRKILESPVMGRDDSEKAIDLVLESVQAGELTRKFFALLARNRRLALTSLISQVYLEKLAVSRGELVVQVTSAKPLSSDEIQTLSQAIASATGKKIDIKTQENPALLGGMQVRVGSRLLDTSIAGKLNRLKQALKNAA